MQDIIEIKNLTKDYGHHKGIFDLSFTIKQGEIFGFLGPNGAGKTTTIRNLLGFINHDGGNCTILGKNCRTEVEEIHKHIGYLPGEITLMDDMKGIEFIEFMAEMYNLKDLSKAKKLIALFDLDTKGKIKKMSKGMKQKIGIVCAFMHDPDILILDEPTSGLDPLMQNTFVELLLSEKKAGKTILMSSHMFEEVEKTCDRVAIIKDGILATIKDIHELKREQKNRYFVGFSTDKEAKRFIKENPDAQSVSDSQVIVPITSDLNALLKQLTAYDVVKIDMEILSLERLFMTYYGGKKDA